MLVLLLLLFLLFLLLLVLMLFLLALLLFTTGGKRRKMGGKAAGAVTWRQSLEWRVGSEELGKKGVLGANADAAAGDGRGSAAREERAQAGRDG